MRPSEIKLPRLVPLNQIYDGAEMIIFLHNTNRVIVANMSYDAFRPYDEVDDFRNECGLDEDDFYSMYEPFYNDRLKGALESSLKIDIDLILLGWF